MNWSQRMVLNVSKVMFVADLMISLWGLKIAETHALGFFPRFEVASPWMLSGIFGAFIWNGERRGEITLRYAGPLLMMLAILVVMTYSLLGKA
jgi:hypothetical protein